MSCLCLFSDLCYNLFPVIILSVNKVINYYNSMIFELLKSLLALTLRISWSTFGVNSSQVKLCSSECNIKVFSKIKHPNPLQKILIYNNWSLIYAINFSIFYNFILTYLFSNKQNFIHKKFRCSWRLNELFRFKFYLRFDNSFVTLINIEF